MGQAINQMGREQRLHSISFTPIHKNIQYIIPWLEQRQEATKRLYEYSTKLTDAEKENYEQLINHCEYKISELLNFNQCTETKDK